jgi:hypothetical protein
MDGREEAAVTGVLCVHVCIISDFSAAAGPGSSPIGVFRWNEIRVSLYTIHRHVPYCFFLSLDAVKMLPSWFVAKQHQS